MPKRKDPTPDCFKDPKFIKERRKWYKKLERAGFNDIEYEVGDTGEGQFLQGPNPADILARWTPAKQRYYELARQHVWTLLEGKASKKTCKIWEMHSDGQSIATIVKKTRFSRHIVAKTIREQRRIMIEAANAAGQEELLEEIEDYLEDGALEPGETVED